MQPVPYRPLWALLFFVSLVLPQARSAQPPAPTRAVIGNAVVPLSGMWRFHPGDDLAWAGAGYDDSAWARFDLTPPPGSIDPTTGATGFLPGWTSMGYPKLTGYAWYRKQIDVESGSGAELPPLSIRMPEDIDDAYQVYVNGQLVGGFGIFRPDRVTFINAQPRAFPLPANLRPGPVTIAIRMWMDKATPFMSQDAGGMHGVPLLGEARSIDSMLALSWDEIDRAQATGVVRIPFFFGVVLLGLLLFWLDRGEKAYLWLALACFAYMLNLALTLVGYYATGVSMVTEAILTDVLLNPIQFCLWAIFWGCWFRLPELRWIHRVVWSLLALLIVGVAMLRAPLYGTVIPVTASAWLLPVTVAIKVAFTLVTFWIVYRGIVTRGVEGWLALAPTLLMPFWLLPDELSTLHLIWLFHIHGFTFGLNSIGSVLTLGAVAVLMLLRFAGGMREKQLLQTELDQARQVQQVLIPEALPTIPGFQINSEYRPARQVGGDFFQILELEGGAFLAVIGDVSGKGMPAAMTVSLLVGAVRTALSFTGSPAGLLSVLNTRMIGRGQGGFTTCLIVRVEADGSVTAANAGHLAPYLNGREVAVANGLPLGLSASAAYGETLFRLAPGSRLTLITDGVVEARSKTGELYGFERAAAISTQPAEEIARTAQNFGQDDDITVLGVERQTAEASTAPAKISGLETSTAPA